MRRVCLLSVRGLLVVGLVMLGVVGSGLALGTVAGGSLGRVPSGTGGSYQAASFSEWLWGVYYRGRHQLRPENVWEQEIARRGVLRVAVRTRALAVPPGTPHAEVPEAYDLALAHYMADRLRVRLEVIGLAPGEQAEALAAGHVDIALGGAASVPVSAPRESDRVEASYFEGQGRLLVLPLAGQPPEERGNLAAHSICVDGSGPYRAVVEQAAGASRVQAFSSALVAISAFTANQCDALVDDAELLERLMTLDAMKYYQLTPIAINGSGLAPVLVATALPAVRAQVDTLVDTWKRTGAARQAGQRRAAEILIEVAQLQDGYSCH